MGIKDFQNFIEKDPTLSKVGVNGIDLVKTAWKMNKGKGQVRPAGLKKRRISNVSICCLCVVVCNLRS
jgi:hypothetical protein